MALDNSIAKEIASKAWSEVMHSIIEDSPPDDMSREYYYEFPESGFEYLQKQLKHLQMHRYKLGTDNIQAGMTSGMNSQVAEVDEHENENKNQQEIEHIQDHTLFIKHSEVVPANKDEYDQGIVIFHKEVQDEYQQEMEHVQDTRSTATDHKVTEGEYHMGIEHIREADHSICVLEDRIATAGDYHIGIEHIQEANHSSFELKDRIATAGDYHIGIEHIQEAIHSNCVLKDTIATDCDYHIGIEHIQEAIHSNCVLKDTIATDCDYHIGIEHIQEAIHSNCVFKDTIATDCDYHIGIEHIQEAIHSNCVLKDTIATDCDYHIGIDNIQEANYTSCDLKDRVATAGQQEINKNVEYEGVQEDEDENQQEFEHEGVQEDEDENQQEFEYEKTKVLSIFSELLELVEQGDQPGEEQFTPRSEVLEAVQLLHDTGGVDVARSVLEKELEKEHGYNDTHPIIQLQKKVLEILLRICGTETCQSTLCKIIGKAKGHTVSCVHCKVEQANVLGMQANEEENLPGMQAIDISTMFDELLVLVKDGDLQQGEKPTMRFPVLKLIRVLHHYGVDTIRSAVEEELLDVSQKYDDIEKNPEVQYKKKGLEVMLKICNIETCQETFYRIIGTTERGAVYYTE